MEMQIVLVILGAASVASTLVHALKSLLDQIPELIRSFRRIVREVRRPDESPEDESPTPARPGSRIPSGSTDDR